MSHPASPSPRPLALEAGDLFDGGLRAINLGLELFADELARAGVPVVHVDWVPPAGGDLRLAALLDRLDDAVAD